MVLPDYHGGSIVNLMASIVEGLGGAPGPYAPLRSLAPEHVAAAHNVVLIVFDGLGHGRLMQSAQAPHLQGHVKDRITSVFPSTTATAIPVFMTGQAPQQHGLTGWHMYFRELGTIAAVLPFRTRLGARPLGPGVDVNELLQPDPVFARLPVASHVISPRRIIDSDFNAAFSRGAQRHGYDTLEEFFGTMAWLLEHPQRKYIYAYYPEIDSLAHEHGIASPLVEQHLARVDAAFGQLLARAAGTDTLVIACADHGFVDVTSDAIIDLAQHPALADMLLVPLCGERRMAYAYVHAHRGTEFEAYLKAHLSDVVTAHKTTHAIADGWFGLGEPHRRLRERAGRYVLTMKRNCVLMEWLPGERRYSQVGVHGGVSDDEMWVPLIVAAA